MSDLITIQGNAEQLRSLTDIRTLKILHESGKPLDDTRFSVDAYADDVAKAATEAVGCTVTLVKTEAELAAELQRLADSINDTPLDFSGEIE
jgi:hypothetical protein